MIEEALLGVRPEDGVVRLAAAGPSRANVIAKALRGGPGATERLVYETVLPDLGVDSPRFLGVVEGKDGTAWLVLEELDGDPFDPSRGEHRAAAGRWLGRLHATAASSEVARRLPEKGAQHHREVLAAARVAVEAGLENVRLPVRGGAVLLELRGRLAELEERWPRLEAWLGAVPPTLVHGDLAAKNGRVRSTAEGLVFAAYDWESAGWGPPAADLAAVDVDSYRQAVAGWKALGRTDLRTLAACGRVFRHLALVAWARHHLEGESVEPAVDFKLRHYERWLAGDLARLP
jgi:aminoglycoside phosphotransferase (APT) family kinase protein